MSKTTNGRAADTGAKIGRGAVAANGANAKPEKSGGIWHNVTRGDVVYLKSPDGARYYGTAAEVRDAALYPSRREGLAEKLRMFHGWYVRGSMSREELARVTESRRRDAIMYSVIDRLGNVRDIDEDTRTVIEAAARATRTIKSDFIRAAVAVAIDEARRANGGKLPYTRHEREALEKSGVTVGSAATVYGSRGLICA